MLTTQAAEWITVYLERAEPAVQSIVTSQHAQRNRADAKDELESLSGLQRTDDSWYHA